jgi:hypothetical protein
MAAGGFTAAAGAPGSGGVGFAASEAPAPGGSTAPIAMSAFFGWGATLAGSAATECHRPSCQDESASVTINAPTASPPKNIGLFTTAPMENP